VTFDCCRLPLPSPSPPAYDWGMYDFNQMPLAKKAALVVAAPFLMFVLGAVVPVLMLAFPLYIGPVAIWRVVRQINRRDDPRCQKPPPDDP
jgi:hypothetical protein